MRPESTRLSPRPDRLVASRPSELLASLRTTRHVGSQLFRDGLLTIRATFQCFASSDSWLRLRAAATAAFPNCFPDAANPAFMPRRTLGVCIRARTASNSGIASLVITEDGSTVSPRSDLVCRRWPTDEPAVYPTSCVYCALPSAASASNSLVAGSRFGVAVNANVTVKFVINEKGNPPGKLGRCRTALHRRRARRVGAPWLRRVGAPIRRRPERDLPRPSVLREWRAVGRFSSPNTLASPSCGALSPSQLRSSKWDGQF